MKNYMINKKNIKIFSILFALFLFFYVFYYSSGFDYSNIDPKYIKSVKKFEEGIIAGCLDHPLDKMMAKKIILKEIKVNNHKIIYAKYEIKWIFNITYGFIEIGGSKGSSSITIDRQFFYNWRY